MALSISSASHPARATTRAHAEIHAADIVVPGPRSAATTVASKCSGCHASESASQPRTPMAQALETPGLNPLLKSHSRLTYHRGVYSYVVETVRDRTTYQVTDGKETLSLPVRWSMGLGGQTWVVERNGKLYESLVSYYPAIDGLDITTGDESLSPQTLEEAMGRQLSAGESKSCFGCHATNSWVNGKLALDALKPGLTCEHCHEGSLTHAADAAQGSFDTVPRKLSQMSSEGVLNFCGQCHRTWETVARAGWRGPQNVRFQAYRLANSRCFDGADRRIGCVACHDPHKDVVRRSAAYDAKCLACHAAPIASESMGAKLPMTSSAEPTGTVGSPVVGSVHELGKVCPVAQSNCSTCHMPKVTLPAGNGHLTFTDHQIRVVRPGDPYPN